MPVLGKNAGGVVNQRITTTLAVNNTSVAGGIYAACRTSLVVKEAGVTIVQGSVSTNSLTDTAFTCTIFALPPKTATGSAIPIAVASVGSGQAVGSEFTTRDASLSFSDNTGSGGPNYKNASERVFPKGTQIYAIPTVAGSAGDVVVAYIQTEEFGAPPA
jgi:hypothetical protein